MTFEIELIVYNFLDLLRPTFCSLHCTLVDVPSLVQVSLHYEQK